MQSSVHLTRKLQCQVRSAYYVTVRTLRAALARLCVQIVLRIVQATAHAVKGLGRTGVRCILHRMHLYVANAGVILLMHASAYGSTCMCCTPLLHVLHACIACVAHVYCMCCTFVVHVLHICYACIAHLYCMCCTHTLHVLHTYIAFFAHIYCMCYTPVLHVLHTCISYVAHLHCMCCTLILHVYNTPHARWSWRVTADSKPHHKAK